MKTDAGLEMLHNFPITWALWQLEARALNKQHTFLQRTRVVLGTKHEVAHKYISALLRTECINIFSDHSGIKVETNSDKTPRKLF